MKKEGNNRPGDCRDVVERLVPDDRTDVCLVAMPYGAITHPSIACGLLKGTLAGSGFSTYVCNANLMFAESMGLTTYRLVTAVSTMYLLGEWTFAGAAFPDFQPDKQLHLEKIASNFLKNFCSPDEDLRNTEGVLSRLQLIREMAVSFVDVLAAMLVRKNVSIVGCTSSFVQHVPSLALLRRVKELNPCVVTMIGGANCEGIMGAVTAQAFPWVDIAFNGEADDVFADLCRLAMKFGPEMPEHVLPEGAMNAAVAQHILDAGIRSENMSRGKVENIDSLPDPDYDEYFDTLAGISFRDEIVPGLLAETSRGCWWGQDDRGCTFCGLNGAGKSYRSKSPDRAVGELVRLSRRHGILGFEVVDNVIDMTYFKTVLPRLASLEPHLKMFYETKANLRRDHVKQLAEAGIYWIQPGIESLHDSILDLMNKGTTTLINLQLLKYAREFGVHCVWHMLVRFPGEDDSWHAETAEWLPLVHHLMPPKRVIPVVFQRFSAYHVHQQKYGLELVPIEGYETIYPLDPAAMNDLAFYLRNSGDDPDPFLKEASLGPGLTKLRKAVRDWHVAQKEFVPPVLCMKDKGEGIEIIDTRACSVDFRTELSGMTAHVLRVLDPSASRRGITARLKRAGLNDVTEAVIDEALEELRNRKLVLESGNRILSLAVPGDIPETRGGFPGGRILSSKSGYHMNL